MSGRLVGEVVEWLLTPAAMGLTPAERAVLLVIAERAHEQTREMWRHRADEISLDERIAVAVGTPRGLQKVLWRLADRDLEVRIPIATGKDGRPVFAARGRAMRFRLPDLPASYRLPERNRADEERPFLPGEPVDNTPSSPVENPEPEPRKGRRSSGQLGERADAGLPNGPERADDGLPLSPSKEVPSKTSPSTPGVPSTQPDVEDRSPVHREPSARDQQFRQPPLMVAVPDRQPSYESARDLLARLPDLGHALMDAARAELGDTTPRAQLVVHAAQLAHLEAS